MSDILKGSDFMIYTGDGMRPIGCEASCALTVTSQLIETTTKGSGGWTNREYGKKDWAVSSNGVVYIQNAFDGTGNLDPLEFSIYQIKGLKVVIKAKFTISGVEKWLIGKGVIESSTYTGPAGEFATYDVQIKADGALYYTDNLNTNAAYDGPEMVIYNSTGSVSYFTNSALVGKTSSSIYAVIKNGIVITDIVYDPSGTITGTSTEDVRMFYTLGSVYFNGGLVSGDEVIIIYEP